MDTKIAMLPRLVIGAVTVSMLVFAAGGCAKKEAEQTEQTQEMNEMEEPAVTPEVASGPAGTYVAEIAMAEGAGGKITLVLNDNNSAMMSVEHGEGQPAMTREGTWAMGEGENVVNFTHGAEGETMTMSFSMVGDELHLMGADAAGFGAQEIAFKKMDQATDPHAGHDH